VDDELLLLGLLSGSAMHGYQLNEVIEQRLSMFSTLKPSTAYSALDRLARGGLVEVTRERVGNRPERKVYHLAEAGRERFLTLLRRNLRSVDGPQNPGQQGLLFSRALPDAEVIELLAERRVATAARLAPLIALHDGHPAGSPARLVTANAIAHLHAEIDWLDRVQAEGLGC
jgi:DNA-binding PadR family transcriptional regulator